MNEAEQLKKIIVMALHEQTKTGLTYGQILATVAILVSLFGIGIQANIRMSKIEIEQNASNIRIEYLEKGRVANQEAIKELAIEYKDLRRENKADHQLILDKLDRK
jgi:uncharacterized lipoprotein YehR (DUF1307 family)